MVRNEFILQGLNKAESRIIEIGPSFSPIAMKRDHWTTTIVDHATRDGLISKYSAYPQLDLSNIEEVDFVWAGGQLHEIFPQEVLGTYDAIIASHVIEHIVDPVAFFNSASHLLHDKGRIILAVPDKRLCFDCLRPVSTCGEMIAAARAKRKRHTTAVIFNAMAYDARPPDTSPSWARGVRVSPKFMGSLEGAAKVIANYQDDVDGEYLDVHGWVFTPASFACIMLELEALGLINWRISQFEEQDAVEFLAIFERGSSTRLSRSELEGRRLQLLIKQLEEAREQANWMLGELGR